MPKSGARRRTEPDLDSPRDTKKLQFSFGDRTGIRRARDSSDPAGQNAQDPGPMRRFARHPSVEHDADNARGICDMTDVIDMGVVQELIELCDDGDPELLLDLVEMFLEDAPNRVRSILEAARSADLEEVERAAHSLKGSAGNLGAKQLQDVAELLQVAGRKADAASIDRLLEPLETCFRDADVALRELVSQYQ